MDKLPHLSCCHHHLTLGFWLYGFMGGHIEAHLALVAFHLILKEALPAHLLQLLPEVLTCLQVRLGDDLGQVI